MVSMWYVPPVVDFPSPWRRFHCLAGSQRPVEMLEELMSSRYSLTVGGFFTFPLSFC